MKRLPGIVWLGIVGVLLASLAGCFGKPPPVQSYLRVRLAQGPCQGESLQRLPLGFKALKAFENLDNTAVLTARGQVLTPSLQYYWEGPPQDMVGQLVRQAIECQSTQFTPVDYQPRVDHAGLLTGTVNAFNVEETEGGRFVVGVHLDLWTKNGKSKVATGDFNAYAPMEDFKPETVAKAASEAMGRVVPKILPWLDSNRAVLEKNNQVQQHQ